MCKVVISWRRLPITDYRECTENFEVVSTLTAMLSLRTSNEFAADRQVVSYRPLFTMYGCDCTGLSKEAETESVRRLMCTTGGSYESIANSVLVAVSHGLHLLLNTHVTGHMAASAGFTSGPNHPGAISPHFLSSYSSYAASSSSWNVTPRARPRH